jgi:heme a synthase
MNDVCAEPRTLIPPLTPWPHRLAVLLCCATFPLVWIGGMVTTYKAGMAVPDWPNTYGYNLFLYPLKTWIFGPWNLFIEHGHRLFAAAVGMLTIALCIVLWKTAQPRWLRILGFFALAGVIAQGILGGMRVLLNEQTLAMIHGCTGPAFFAFTAALAAVSSRRWRAMAARSTNGGTAGLLLMTIATPILAYLQIILGAQVRHIAPDAAPQTFQMFVFFHIAIGLALSVQIIAAAVAFLRSQLATKINAQLALALCGLVIVQLALGCGTWIVKFGWPAILFSGDNSVAFTVEAQSWWQAQITTAHVAVGSLIFALATVQAVFGVRQWWPQLQKSRTIRGSTVERSQSLLLEAAR